MYIILVWGFNNELQHEITHILDDIYFDSENEAERYLKINYKVDISTKTHHNFYGLDEEYEIILLNNYKEVKKC